MLEKLRIYLFGQPNVRTMAKKHNAKGLIKVLQNEEYRFRPAAASALGELRDVRAVDPLIKALANSHDSKLVSAAALALGNIGDPRASAALVAKLDTIDSEFFVNKADSKEVRKAVVSALDSLKWLPPDNLKCAYWITKKKWHKCIALGAAAAPALIAELDDPEAMEVLKKIGAPVVEKLVEALNTKNSTLRNAAREVLSKIGGPSVEPLIALIKGGDGKDSSGKIDYDVKRERDQAAVEALAWIADSRAVEPLIEVMLTHRFLEVQRQAVWALGRIGDQRGVEPLIMLLRNGDMTNNLRVTAFSALEESGGSVSLDSFP